MVMIGSLRIESKPTMIVEEGPFFNGCGWTFIVDRLCCLQDWVDATFEVSKSFNYKISNYCNMILLSCAYAGTGNVLKV